MGKLENLFGAAKEGATDYIRGAADLRGGEDVIVVPDDAVIRGNPQGEPAAPVSPEQQRPTAENPPSGWSATRSTNTSGAWRKVASEDGETTIPSSDPDKRF